MELASVTQDYALPRQTLFRRPGRIVALDGVNLTVGRGRSLGIVGESGAGKSTLARLAMALERPASGTVRFMGHDLNALPHAALRGLRRHFQMVFQDPNGSLDPRQRVGRIVAEPLRAVGGLSAEDEREAIAAVLESVGLHAADRDKYPHEFSGGQRQRIAIARALITRPKLIVADEPVSALDASVQAQVLNLLQDLIAKHGVTLLLISHDLAVVDHLCEEVAVMYRGRIVEQASPERLFAAPAHPYTRLLIDSLPQLSSRPRRRPMRAASTAEAPGGCSFARRCPHVRERCRAEAPVLREVGARHLAACHFAEAITAQPRT